jgi:DNA adenine methylase
MNGSLPHIVQYQGSKRILAPQILKYMPTQFNRLLEPFAGMAAQSQSLPQKKIEPYSIS